MVGRISNQVLHITPRDLRTANKEDMTLATWKKGRFDVSITFLYTCVLLPPRHLFPIDLKRMNHYHTIVNNFELRGALNVTK